MTHDLRRETYPPRSPCSRGTQLFVRLGHGAQTDPAGTEQQRLPSVWAYAETMADAGMSGPADARSESAYGWLVWIGGSVGPWPLAGWCLHSVASMLTLAVLIGYVSTALPFAFRATSES